MKTNIVIVISPPIAYLGNSGSRVMDWDALGQSKCRIL